MVHWLQIGGMKIREKDEIKQWGNLNEYIQKYPLSKSQVWLKTTGDMYARFIKLENIHMPTGKFAISGLRVFGNGNGEKPAVVENFIVLRTEKDKRSAYLKWKPVNNAYAYNIYYGTDPQKLYTCIMVHDFNEYWLKTMDNQKHYFFTIEAINENGVSQKSPILKAE